MKVLKMIRQVGAGPDGVTYQAKEVETDRMVEVRLLRGASLPPLAVLSKRLALARSFTDPGAWQVTSVNITNDPPIIAMEWLAGQSLVDRFYRATWPTLAIALDIGVQLADTLAAAHRVGLVHGNLAPTRVRVGKDGRTRLDFTGLDCELPPRDVPVTIEMSCRPPECSKNVPPEMPGDVYSFGKVMQWFLTGQPAEMDTMAGNPPAKLLELLRQATDVDPLQRPSMREARDQIRALSDHHRGGPGLEPIGAEAKGFGETEDGSLWLGRFRMLNKLGEGGMGAVYRAEDSADGSIVAIKVLSESFARIPDARQRFFKEARILKKVNNPYVANLLEFNEEGTRYYLVLEFVAGTSLGDKLQQRSALPEKEALLIMADASRALSEAHRQGIVHRDVKPDNIVMLNPSLTDANNGVRAKLLDFGLARYENQSQSLNLTEAGAVIGSPFYMSPEQCRGESVDARSDVYSMGATLFHLLTGVPPFQADSVLGLITMHCTEPVPSARKVNPRVSEAAAQVVAKALSKTPEARYRDAEDFLGDIERLLRGEPTNIALHPRLPSNVKKLVAYDFSWELKAPPEALWPFVSNTERLNKAIGLPAVRFTTENDPVRGVRRFAEARVGGLALKWEEHPFEWIENRRMGVLREFSQGPFKQFLSVVEFIPRADGGTTLTQRLRIEPRGLLGRVAAHLEVGIKARHGLTRVYRRIDDSYSRRSENVSDAFAETSALTGVKRRRLERALLHLKEKKVPDVVVDRLGDFIANANAQDVARLRPIAFARQFRLDQEQVIRACLLGVNEGLLVLLWDILCPLCRIPSDVKNALVALSEHSYCPACNVDFETDFANSVEMIFRPHPDVREVESRTFCIGGPAHSPHVVSQMRLAPRERLDLELALGEGAYRLRGPQLPFTVDFRVLPTGLARRWDLHLDAAPATHLIPFFQPGCQLLALSNPRDYELVVRIERAAARADALTAAQASSMALFRELFPDQLLAPGRLVRVASVTLLVTQLDEGDSLYKRHGDASGFALLHESFRLIEDIVRIEGGALVKTVSEGVTAAFNEPIAAIRAALALQPALTRNNATSGLRLRVGVHRGTAMVATINDRLDYFGSMVKTTMQLLAQARGGEMVLPEAVAALPEVAALLRERGYPHQVLESAQSDDPHEVLQRVVLSPSSSPSGAVPVPA